MIPQSVCDSFVLPSRCFVVVATCSLLVSFVVLRLHGLQVHRVLRGLSAHHRQHVVVRGHFSPFIEFAMMLIVETPSCQVLSKCQSDRDASHDAKLSCRRVRAVHQQSVAIIIVISVAFELIAKLLRSWSQSCCCCCSRGCSRGCSQSGSRSCLSVCLNSILFVSRVVSRLLSPLVSVKSSRVG